MSQPQGFAYGRRVTGALGELTRRAGTGLQDYARIADALIAFEQIDLLGLDLPSVAVAHDAVPGPARQDAGLIAPELADEKIRAQHARVVARGGKDLDVGDQAHRARSRRLRPGKSGAQAIDAVLEAAAIVEHDRDLAPRIARGRGRGDPVDALRRVEREPVLVPELVEQPRLALQQHAEALARTRIADRAGVVLPAGEIRDQLAVERVGDVIRGLRLERRRRHVTAPAGSRD